MSTRLSQRQTNLSASPDTTEHAGDASLKRNTAYLKRIRTSLPSADSSPALIAEISQLRLDKYLSELVAAVSEGCLRVKVGSEVASAARVISALHQQFGFTFTTPLITSLISQCKLGKTEAKDESARVSKQRSLLRLLAELEAVGLVRGEFGKLQSAGETTLGLLQDVLLAADKDLLLPHASIAQSIIKHCTFLFPPLDPLPGSTTSAEEVISPSNQLAFRSLLHSYYAALSTKTIKDRSHLLAQEKANNEAYIRHGQLFQDRQQSLEKLQHRWDKMWSALQSLSEGLQLDLPVLPQVDVGSSASGLVVSAPVERLGAEGEQLDPRWSDEEEMRFYVQLKDLHAGVSDQEIVSTMPQEAEDQPEAEEMVAETSQAEPPLEPAAPNEDTETLAAGPASRLSDLLARLPEMTSQNFIDAAALEFVPLNSKAARNRLVKFLHSTPPSRLDLLSFYGRLVATLRPVAPEIASALLGLLENDFRYLQKRKNVELRDLRSKTMRYLGELVKFGLVPPHAVLHCFKALVDDLTHFNVDSTCILLEACGRYVFRQESTAERMTAILEILLRKKAAQNFDARQTSMLESAYYQVNPPERRAVERKAKTPMHLFIHHVVYRILTRANYNATLLLLRKLDWSDAEVQHRLFNGFTKIWKAKFSNIALFALLVYDLGKFHSDLAVSVADRVLENIRLGLERNNFKHNQRRVASIKYLGELYNFQTVDAKVVLDCLWLMVTFGHPDGQPHPDRPTALDAPKDWFRVRLVCTLLDTTYVYLDKGSNKARLDHFLTFFQLYINSKTHPPPMDIDFLLSDTFETVRPKMSLAKSFDEAADAVSRMLAANATAAPLAVSSDESDSDLESERSLNASHSDASDGESDEEGSIQAVSDVSEPQVSATLPAKPGLTEEEEAEFARDLAKMMSDTGGSKGLNSRANLDVGLPLLRRDAASQSSQDHVLFNLLTKKGAKAQVKSFEIPTEAAIAARSREQAQQRALEQQQLKELVLESERRQQSTQDDNEKAELEAVLARRGFRTRSKYSG